jgi:hypothetical protein
MKIDPSLLKILSACNVNDDAYLFVSHGGYGVDSTCYINIRFCRKHPLNNYRKEYNFGFNIVFDEYIEKQFEEDATLYYDGDGDPWDWDIGLKTTANLIPEINFEMPEKRACLKNLFYWILDRYAYSTLKI